MLGIFSAARMDSMYSIMGKFELQLTLLKLTNRSKIEIAFSVRD